MSIQWTLVAGFLFFEVGFISLLLLPFISVKTWSKFFNSKFLKGFSGQSHYYFSVFLFALLLLLCDAIREIYKYQGELAEPVVHGHIESTMQAQMRLFRSQRNFYISGFALFLWVVLRKLVTLTIKQSALTAGLDAAMKQAANASDAASRLMDETKGKHSGSQNAEEQAKYENKIKKLEEELKASKLEAEKYLKDAAVMKKQAEAVNEEYDRLMKEHEKLQVKLESAGDKKAD